jgi:glycosyltransferase involved in cell wall biosynthesis
LLSIIIPALNSATTISRTLSSIFSNSISNDSFEVLVIDNGSTDNTIKIAKTYDVKVYHCEPKGIGPPRNLGIKKAKGNIICFTDSDCIVTNSWLPKIDKFFKLNPQADGIGGPTLPYPFSQNRLQELTGKIFVDEQNYSKTTKKLQFGTSSPFLFGSNSAYKKEALLEVGGFPEPGGSSLELSWKLMTAERNLFFDPDLHVFHVFPSNLRSLFKMYFRWGSQYTVMQKRFRGNTATLYGVACSGYGIARILLSLVSPRNSTEKMLQLNQAIVYFLGRLQGLNRTE